MKKTAAKTRSKSKNVATRVTARPAARHSLVDAYYLQADDFFRRHPNSRVLLGLYIVIYAMFLGLLFHSKAQAMGWTSAGLPY